MNILRRFRSSHRRCSIEKGVLKNLAKGPDLQIFQKRDSGTGVYLWVYRNFQEQVSSNNFKNVYLELSFSNFIKITLRHGCSPVNLMHIFRAPFPKNTSGSLFLKLPRPCILEEFILNGSSWISLGYTIIWSLWGENFIFNWNISFSWILVNM